MRQMLLSFQSPGATVSTSAVNSSKIDVSPFVYSFLNVRSLSHKLDDVLEFVRDNHVNVMCLAETWLDENCAVLGRLRSANFNVVDRPRPRLRQDLSVNHGGLLVFSSDSVRLTVLPFPSPPSFELLCVRVSTGRLSEIIAVIYRPGSQPIQPCFFDDLSVVLDSIASYSSPVHIVGDFNVRLDRIGNTHADRLRSLLDGYGLPIRSSGPTHSHGGTLDAVASVDLIEPKVVDVGLSDHHAISWSSVVKAGKSAVTSDASNVRPWRRLDMESFRAALLTSRLCTSTSWPINVDEMATLYSTEIVSLLDVLLPARQRIRRPRPSDLWFDRDCRAAKRQTRQLERAYAAATRRATSSSAASVASAAAAKAAWYSQRRSYRQMRLQKSDSFWRDKIATNRSEPQKLWRTVDALLGRGRLPAQTTIDVETFNHFFMDKVAKVRARTSSSDPPIFSRVHSGTSFRSFLELSVDDVISAIHRLPDKSSAADPMPTPVLKQVADLIAPFLTALFNHSLATGLYPALFKEAFITPIVKKAGMDAADVNSYRPISNLPVISKLFERLVARQLMGYLTAADLLPPRQSGFRPGHSTETAILRVLSDILQSVDRGDVAVLILLDLSAAFDTVDHDILLQRLQCSFGVDDSALSWLQSYLFGRTQYVLRGSLKSSTAELVCGVPQGSVLGPLLFILYTADLVHLIERFSLSAQLYADDTQVYGSCQPSEIHRLSSSITECISAVSDWMKSNRLQLNPDKTEVLWCTTGQRQHQLPTTSFQFGGVHIQPAASVRNLGVFIDADLVMRTHVSKVTARCFGSPSSASSDPSVVMYRHSSDAGHCPCAVSLGLL